VNFHGLLRSGKSTAIDPLLRNLRRVANWVAKRPPLIGPATTAVGSSTDE